MGAIAAGVASDSIITDVDSAIKYEYKLHGIIHYVQILTRMLVTTLIRHLELHPSSVVKNKANTFAPWFVVMLLNYSLCV